MMLWTCPFVRHTCPCKIKVTIIYNESVNCNDFLDQGHGGKSCDSLGLCKHAYPWSLLQVPSSTMLTSRPGTKAYLFTAGGKLESDCKPVICRTQQKQSMTDGQTDWWTKWCLCGALLGWRQNKVWWWCRSLYSWNIAKHNSKLQ